MKLKPSKNSRLNGIRTHDLYDTGAVLYQPNWELVMLWVRYIFVDGEECNWISLFNYGERSKDMNDHRSYVKNKVQLYINYWLFSFFVSFSKIFYAMNNKWSKIFKGSKLWRNIFVVHLLSQGTSIKEKKACVFFNSIHWKWYFGEQQPKSRNAYYV